MSFFFHYPVHKLTHLCIMMLLGSRANMPIPQADMRILSPCMSYALQLTIESSDHTFNIRLRRQIFIVQWNANVYRYEVYFRQRDITLHSLVPCQLCIMSLIQKHRLPFTTKCIIQNYIYPKSDQLILTQSFQNHNLPRFLLIMVSMRTLCYALCNISFLCVCVRYI